MMWTVELHYVLGGVDLAMIQSALPGAAVTGTARPGRVQVTIDVEARFLRTAVDAAAEIVADAVPDLAKPERIQAMSASEYLSCRDYPPPLDLVGLTEIAMILGVSRQRAGQLASSADFPPPVASVTAGRFYTRDSVLAFQDRRRTR